MIQAVDLPNLLRNVRLQNGWTRQEMADRLGVSTYTLKNWEYSGRSPHWDNIAPRLQRLGKLIFVFEGEE